MFGKFQTHLGGVFPIVQADADDPPGIWYDLLIRNFIQLIIHICRDNSFGFGLAAFLQKGPKIGIFVAQPLTQINHPMTL